MTKLFLLAAAGALTAPAAFATGGIYCDGVSDASVGAYLTVGRAPGFHVVEARIYVMDKAWSMRDEEGAEQVEFVQGAIAGDFVVADFSDANIENMVASLRLAQVESQDGVIAGGFLSIHGVGAWPVACEVD